MPRNVLWGSAALLIVGAVTFYMGSMGGPWPTAVQDFLEWVGTGLFTLGALVVVRHLAGWTAATKLFTCAIVLLATARGIDFVEELPALAGTPVLGQDAWGNTVGMRLAESSGYMLTLLSMLVILREVARGREAVRREKERYLSASEDLRLLGQVADMAAEAVIGCTPDGRVRIWGGGATRLFGYSREEASGMPLRELVVSGLRRGHVDGTARSPVGDDAGRDLDVVCRRKDGATFHGAASISSVFDEEGSNVGTSLVVRDIDRRKEAEGELVASRDLLAGALQHADVGAFIISRKDEYLVAYNVAMERITGVNRAEMRAAANAEEAVRLLAPDRMGFVHRLRRDVFRAGKPIHWRDLRVKLPAGERILNLTVTPVRNSRAEVIAAVGMVVDHTEREALQTSLLASQKLESVGRLAGGVAHDFNNILAGIMGYASLLREQFPETTSTGSYAAAIEESAQRAAELTAQLLAFSRGERYNKERLDLNELAGDTARLVRASLNPNVSLELALAPDLLAVEADPTCMRQVILNLCINARDAMETGGAIMVSTANVDRAGAGPDMPAGGPFVRLRVADTGSGMSKEVAERVFEPFFTTKADGRSYGLGLSVVYGIVESHGGRIAIDSQAGRGTVFDVYLPAVGVWTGDGGGDLEESMVQDAKQDGNATILVVDDEELIRLLLSDVLVSQGFEVVEAASGEEAVAICRERDGGIDLVVLDLLMPGIGGGQALDEMRAMQPALRCVVSSGFGSETLDPAYQEDELVRFVPKPYRASEMAVTIRELLQADAPA